MTAPQQFKARVAEHIVINEKFQFVHLELIEPDRIEFEAGQYISVDMGEGYRRSYSIASAPSENHAIELCVDITPGKRGSQYFQNLKPGDEMKFMAPLGRFIMTDEDKVKEEKLLFVATGSGITPLRSTILDLLEDKNDKRLIRLFWGLRFVKDMFWEEEFRLKHESFPNFHYKLMLSKPPEKWPLLAGYSTHEIEALELDRTWGVYLCGNPEMISEVKELVIKKGVPENQVHFEKFF